MEHFSLEEWVDFVRGVPEEDVRQPLLDHLDRCHQCSDLVAKLESVAATVRHDARFQVPSAVLLRAYGIFQSPAPDGSGQTYLQWVAGLIFDSWAEPLPEGVRSADQATRQLSYRSGDLRVELSIERVPKTTSVLLTGQVHTDAGERQGMPVRLMAGQRVLADGITNEFGEFVLKGRPKENTHLSILEPNRRIQLLIPLPEIKAYALPVRIKDSEKE